MFAHVITPTQTRHWEAVGICPSGRKGLQAKVKKWTCDINMYPTWVAAAALKIRSVYSVGDWRAADAGATRSLQIFSVVSGTQRHGHNKCWWEGVSPGFATVRRKTVMWAERNVDPRTFSFSWSLLYGLGWAPAVGRYWLQEQEKRLGVCVCWTEGAVKALPYSLAWMLKDVNPPWRETEQNVVWKHGKKSQERPKYIKTVSCKIWNLHWAFSNGAFYVWEWLTAIIASLHTDRGEEERAESQTWEYSQQNKAEC